MDFFKRPPKKTPEEWLHDPDFANYIVTDPTGWRNNWEEEITKNEMWTRLVFSTVKTKK